MERSSAMEFRRKLMLRFKEDGGLGSPGITSLQDIDSELLSICNVQAQGQLAKATRALRAKKGKLGEDEITAGLVWLRALSIPYELTATGSIHRSYQGVRGEWHKITSPENDALTRHTLRTALKDCAQLTAQIHSRVLQKYCLTEWMRSLSGDKGSPSLGYLGLTVGNIEDYLAAEAEYFDTLYEEYLTVITWAQEPQDRVTRVCRQLQLLSPEHGCAAYSPESEGSTPSTRRKRKKPKSQVAESGGRDFPNVQNHEFTGSAVEEHATTSKENSDLGLPEPVNLVDSGESCDGTCGVEKSGKQLGNCENSQGNLAVLLRKLQEGVCHTEEEQANARQQKFQIDLAESIARQEVLKQKLSDAAAQQKRMQQELDDAHAEQKRNLAILGRIILKKVAHIKTLSQQLETEVEKSLCEICCSRPRSEVILPCMHFLFCSDCLKEYRQGNDKCPTCRGAMGGSMNLRFV